MPPDTPTSTPVPVRVADLKPGHVIPGQIISARFLHDVEVTFTKKSRRYPGYQELQVRPVGDIDLSRVTVHNLPRSAEVVARRAV